MAQSLEGALVTGTSQDARSRIYLVHQGEKQWILTPEVFAERGWKFADVIVVPDVELESIPTSSQVIGEPPQLAQQDRARHQRISEPFQKFAQRYRARQQISEPSLEFAQRDRVRQRISEPFLEDVGIELGAGLYPQPLPDGVRAELFELRDPGEVARLFGTNAESVPRFSALEEIETRFPDGANFLIAHNVLEHCADPIGTLIAWSRYVRDGGILVLSVPCGEYCPDKGRLVPTIGHVVLDYLLTRDADSFESREHAYSCTAGWMNTWEDWIGIPNEEVARRAHEKAHMHGLDVHWHTFTPELFDQVLQAAARFAERPLHLVEWGTPYLEGDAQTRGDIIGLLRVGGARPADTLPWHSSAVTNSLDATESQLAAALARLRETRQAI